MKYILVMIGAGLGGGLRFYIAALVQKLLPVYFPYGTLTVNFLGSLLLGFIIFGFDEKELLSPNFKLLLGVGFCGGFTTFSTFSLETFNLIRDTEFLYAGLNVMANVILTISAVYISYIITK